HRKQPAAQILGPGRWRGRRRERTGGYLAEPEPAARRPVQRFHGFRRQGQLTPVSVRSATFLAEWPGVRRGYYIITIMRRRLMATPVVVRLTAPPPFPRYRRGHENAEFPAAFDSCERLRHPGACPAHACPERRRRHPDLRRSRREIHPLQPAVGRHAPRQRDEL